METFNMKRILVTTLVAFALAGSAYAAPGFEGNTVRILMADGTAVGYFLDTDGSYQSSSGTSGAWTYDGANLCLDEFCGPFDADKAAGDSWEADAWDGSGTLKSSIEAGNTLDN